MNEKTVKKARKLIREQKPEIIELYRSLQRRSLRERLRLAWGLVRGVR